jgi:hypothetical protein
MEQLAQDHLGRRSPLNSIQSAYPTGAIFPGECRKWLVTGGLPHEDEGSFISRTFK